jgi:hypothetical protein
VSAFFVLCGIMSFMWVPKLKVTGPYLYKNHPAINRWRIKVHNEGPAAAVNVRMLIHTQNIAPGALIIDIPYSL